MPNTYWLRFKSHEERFWLKVNKDAPNGCWEWTGYRCSNNYGYWKQRDSKIILPHRFAYEQLVGPIPDGLVLDHLCRNPPCVNPEHLEPVTQRVNLLRGIGGSARAARVTHCPSGHPYDLLNTYYHKDGSRDCRPCRQQRTREHRIAVKEGRKEASPSRRPVSAGSPALCLLPSVSEQQQTVVEMLQGASTP